MLKDSEPGGKWAERFGVLKGPGVCTQSKESKPKIRREDRGRPWWEKDASPRWTPVDFYCSLHISPSGTVTGTGQERVAVVSIQGQSLEGFWVHVALSWRQCWSCFPQCQVSRSYLCPFVPMLGKEGGEESCAVSTKVTQLLVSVPTHSAPAAPDCRVGCYFWSV